MTDSPGSGRGAKSTLSVLGAIIALVSLWWVTWQRRRHGAPEQKD